MEKEKKKVLFLSLLSVLIIVLIPTFTSVGFLSKIFIYFVIPLCLIILVSKIDNKEHSVYGLCLGIIGVYFAILIADYIVHRKTYTIDLGNIIMTAITYIVISIITFLITIKTEKPRD
jgi:type III secretory pathway component EscU